MEKEFTEQINKHQKILHKICSVYFYRNPNIEDYYQEILIRLWKSYPSFKGQSTFATWLYRVALNTAIDILRKQTIQPTHIGLSENERNIPDFNQQIFGGNLDDFAINRQSFGAVRDISAIGDNFIYNCS